MKTYKFILIFFIMNMTIFSYSKSKHLIGSKLSIQSAIKKSMIMPLSNLKEIKYNVPLIAKCIAINSPIEPGQIIINSCYLYQKFKVIEILSGIVNKKIQCDYKIDIKRKEIRIPKNKTLILILKRDKRENYHKIIKAIIDNIENRKHIIKTIKKLTNLINWK